MDKPRVVVIALALVAVLLGTVTLWARYRTSAMPVTSEYKKEVISGFERTRSVVMSKNPAAIRSYLTQMYPENSARYSQLGDQEIIEEAEFQILPYYEGNPDLLSPEVQWTVVSRDRVMISGREVGRNGTVELRRVDGIWY